MCQCLTLCACTNHHFPCTYSCMKLKSLNNDVSSLPSISPPSETCWTSLQISSLPEAGFCSSLVGVSVTIKSDVTGAVTSSHLTGPVVTVSLWAAPAAAWVALTGTEEVSLIWAGPVMLLSLLTVPVAVQSFALSHGGTGTLYAVDGETKKIKWSPFCGRHFRNHFSRMRVAVICFNFGWILFPIVQLAIKQQLIQIMPWFRIGGKPLSQPVIAL